MLTTRIGRSPCCERLAQHEARLRHHALDGVHQQQHGVHHAEHALDLAAEVGVAGRVDQVDVDALEADRRVLGVDRDAALALLRVAVHHALDRGLLGRQRAGLAQQAVEQRRLAVVDVRDDREVADFLARAPAWGAQASRGSAGGDLGLQGRGEAADPATMRHILRSALAFVTLLASADPASADTALALAAAGDHSCAVNSQGGVVCWGDNDYGQLGDGTTADRDLPVAVPGLSGVATVSTGATSSCALTATGAVWCWGANVQGQLGNGTTAPSGVPVPVSGLSSGVASISVGSEHACALTSQGEALCWGRNRDGQLGNGSYTISLVPVPVSGLESGTLQIAAAQIHTCAVAAGGAAHCWGTMASSLGDGVTSVSNVPVAVTGLGSGVTALAVGHEYSDTQRACALTQAGAVLCWGSSDGGAYSETGVPALVPGLASGVAALAMGSRHSCVVTTSHGVLCWGEGALGSAFPSNGQPVPVYGLAHGVSSLAAGRNHTCALLQSGGLRCWGSDVQGQIGNAPGPAPSATPLPVVGLESGVTAIAAGASQPGYRRTCAVKNGSAWCWGSLAGFPPHLPTLTEGDVSDVSVASTLTCMLKSAGSASCVDFGEFFMGTPVSLMAPGSVASVDAGEDTACAVTTGGGITCWWGEYSYSPDEYRIPVVREREVYASGMTAVKAFGGSHACGLSTAGGVSCWRGYEAPIAVPGLESGVVQMDGCPPHACAVTTSGDVLFWDSGSEATPMLELSGVAVVSGGYQHTCVLLDDATVHCWGDNTDLQLGVESLEYSDEPVPASSSGPVRSPSRPAAITRVRSRRRAPPCAGVPTPRASAATARSPAP